MLRTMLAATLDHSDLTPNLFDKGPLILQPKYDGIRLQYDHGTCYTGRSGKELRNRWITQALRDQLGYQNHLDGELLAIGPDEALLPMHDTVQARGTESICMTGSDEPVAFSYFVFDSLFDPQVMYQDRLLDSGGAVSREVHLVPYWCYDTCAGIEAEINYVIEKYSPEGVMFRLASGLYKQGRSTLAERGLMKYKPFTDLDVTIVGATRLYRNRNEATINTWNGLSERSKDMANLEPVEALGSFTCVADGFMETFDVGTGFTEYERYEFWKLRNTILGSHGVIKYLKSGTKDRPRNPVWLRRRLVD